MAIDINEMRKNNTDAVEVLNSLINCTKEHDISTLCNSLNSKSFDEALLDFMKESMQIFSKPFSMLMQDFDYLYNKYNRFLSYYIFVDTICSMFELVGEYCNDDLLCTDNGFPFMMCREVYISFCLDNYLHTGRDDLRNYYKVRVEEGCNCIINGDISQLMKEHQSWGIEGEAEYSFVTYWKTCKKMPDLLRTECTGFMIDLKKCLDFNGKISYDCEFPIEGFYSLIRDSDDTLYSSIGDIHQALMLAWRLYDRVVKLI